MCRSVRHHILALALVTAVAAADSSAGSSAVAAPETTPGAASGLFPATAAATVDDVAEYLRRHGLDDLLIIHFERRLAEGQGEERLEFKIELAVLYANMLELPVPQDEEDRRRREEIESRSRELLAEIPVDRAVELRIALSRAGYRRAERIAEAHRLRRAEDNEVEDARQTLERVVEELDDVRAKVADQHRSASRRLDAASPDQVDSMLDDVDRLRRLHDQAVFLLGWAGYYLAFLSDERSERSRFALDAESAFTLILSPEKPVTRLQLDDVALDLAGAEGFARSVLGVAMCRLLREGAFAAEPWLDLLDDSRTHIAVRNELPGWRIIALAEGGRYRELHQFIRNRLEAVDHRRDFPSTFLMLAAIPPLESDRADAGTVHARSVIETVVTELGLREELTILMELADRYGVDELGGRGFAVSYVAAMVAYDKAREAHGSAEPTSDPEVIALYDEAIANASAAVSNPDAARFVEAAAGCHALIGWSRFYQGRFSEAADAFLTARENLVGDLQLEAHWMALVSLERISAERRTPGQSRLIARLTDEFLDRYPLHPHASRLNVRRLAAAPASIDAVGELLAVSPESDVYDRAQRQAGAMLYRLYRDAVGRYAQAASNQFGRQAADIKRESEDLARQLLAVSRGIFDRAVARLQAEDTVESRASTPADDLILSARWILDVSLSDESASPDLARRTLDELDRFVSQGAVDPGEHRPEFLYRRVQVELRSHDSPENVVSAMQSADDLHALSPESNWSLAASSRILHEAVAGPQSRDVESIIIRTGQRILAHSQYDRIDRDQLASYALSIAASLNARWERDGREEDGRAALEALEQFSDELANNRTAMRLLARLQMGLGMDEEALEAWRRISSGSRVGTEPWYEGRYHVIDILSRIDPQRAREVLEQHRQLNPDYGPDPWGAKLRTLAEKMSNDKDQEQ